MRTSLLALVWLVACGRSVQVDNPLSDPADGPPAGNPNAEATCDVPASMGLEDTSTATTVVGDGTPGSCTGDRFVDAVAAGGVITFDCGPDPVTIELEQTARVFSAGARWVSPRRPLEAAPSGHGEAS